MILYYSAPSRQSSLWIQHKSTRFKLKFQLTSTVSYPAISLHEKLKPNKIPAQLHFKPRKNAKNPYLFR